MEDTFDENQAVKRLDTDKKTALLTGRDFWTTQDYSSCGIPPLRFSDGPHGLRVQAGDADNFGLLSSLPATCFPCLSAIACSWDAAIARELGEKLGEEAASFGVNVLLGPGVNLKRDPLCGRNFEYFSEDEDLAGVLAAEYIKGVQSRGVAACVKHFACNNREFARNVYSSQVSSRALHEVYLTTFERAVREGGAAAVMTAYNKLNGTYCSENQYLISDILRGQWGFDGIVISDWVGTSDRAAGVRAGEDLEMPRCVFTPDELKAALMFGTLSEEDIDACCRRIARFAHRWTHAESAPFKPDEHMNFARRAAKCGAVLLKNDGALPLKKGSAVAVLGALAACPHIQGGGSAFVNAEFSDDILSCLNSKFMVTGFAEGYDRYGRHSGRLLKRALKQARSAQNVVVFLGLTEREDAEGADRQSYSLPAAQLRLLAALNAQGIRPVAVLCSGSAVDTSWDEMCSAVLYMPLTGAGTGTAVADILCGDFNPCGKLAFTFPADYSNSPCGAKGEKDPYICRYKEDILVGYRWYDAAALPVKYPFGHGLSYAQFEYSRLSATERGIALRVKNTGTRAGEEVVQVYICPPDFSLPMPVKKLAGWQKVSLKPGEEQAVLIPLDRSALRVYDENSGNFVIYAGEYGVQVGSSSRDIRLCGSIKVNGVQPPAGSGGRAALVSYASAPSAPAAKPERGRKEIDMHSPLIDLKRAKGLFGRLLYAVADFYCTSKRQTALLTFRYITVRSAMQYAGFTLAQAHGFIDVCNGRFIKGIKAIISGRKKKPARGRSEGKK